MSRKKQKNKKNFKLKIILFLLFVFLFIFIADKFTGNNINNFFVSLLNNQLIKKNPDSLIISIQSNKDEIATIPLITFNNINIDWGDGNKEEYLTHRIEKDINNDDNIYNDIIIPAHRYKSKGNYKVIITGDTNRGFFGHIELTTTDQYGKNMFKNEFLNNLPLYIKDESSNILTNYLSLIEEKNNKDNNSNNNKNKNNFNIQNFVSFKNLNFKGLGNLNIYIENEINTSWLDEFTDIEIFIETFANSNISYIPENIFKLSPNLRILSGTFFSCKKIESIPEDLIPNLDNIENVRYCFSNTSNLIGKAPNWWDTMAKLKKETKVENLPYLLCFNECKNLENYNEIPFFWGGILNINE